MKKVLTVMIAAMVFIILLGQLLPSQPKTIKKIPILAYHHISEDPRELNDLVITPQKFREDMLYLKACGYHTITFQELINHKEKSAPLPENPIIVTFDDGYRSNYIYAYPILKELNLKAVISIIGIMIKDENETGEDNKMLTWEELKEMVDSQVFEVQAHSYDLHHWDDKQKDGGVARRKGESAEEYSARFRNDTQKLKDLIYEKLGVTVTIYTYPYGIYSGENNYILKEMGFKGSLLGEHGIGNCSHSLFSLKRINMSGSIPTPQRFKTIKRLDNKHFTVPFVDIADQQQRIAELEKLLGIKANNH